MSVESEILDLVKQADPANPTAFVCSIVQEYSLSKMYSYMEQCKDCAISEGVKCLPSGNANATMMFICDPVPTESAPESDDPLDPESRKMFETAINNNGNINLSELFYINAVSCWPYKMYNNTCTRRTPTRNEMDNCSAFVWYAIDVVKPKVIVLLGNTALNMFQRRSINEARGQWFKINNIDAIATYHPHYLIDVLDKKSETEVENIQIDFADDIGRALLFIKERWPESNLFKGDL
jgi:uracil-DNA glycosylase family 4